MEEPKNQQLLVAISFIITIMLTRTILHLGANIEFVTAFIIAAAFLFKDTKYIYLSLFGGLLISDLIIGNTIIFVFTWSGFLFAAVLGKLGQKATTSSKTITKMMASEFAGVTSTLLFFFWTNLGVVLTTNMYEKNMIGLTESYINALPFLKVQLGWNLVLVPLAVGAVLLAQQLLVNTHKNSLLKEKPS